MGDEDDGGAGGAKLAQDREEPIDLRRGQGRGRFVQDQQPGIAAQRAGDLDDLALRQRELANRPAKIDILAQPVDERLCLGAHRRHVDPEAARLVAEMDVLGRVQIADQAGILIDHGDAPPAGIGGAGEQRGHAVEAQVPRVRLIGAGENAHQGRFAGAVLADERMDLARPAVEGNVPQRLHAGERLGDSFDREGRCRLAHHLRGETV